MIVVTLHFKSAAQDIHLSQFYTADHLLNPAKVGDFDGDFRVIGNYRNQWAQINSNPINSYLASFDKAYRFYSYEFDYGILVAHDEFTGYQTKATKVLLSIGSAYTYKGHKFRVGLQPGLVFKSTDLDPQTFPGQWDYYPDPSLSSIGFFNPDAADPDKDNLIKDAQSYFDLNVGVQWSRRMGKFEPKAGVGINHINRPKDTYFDSPTERLRARKVLYTELNYFLSGNITLQPKFVWMWTSKANELLMGANVEYKLAHKVIPKVFGGVYYRSGAGRNVDALFPIVGFGYKRFDFGFSYDVNVSSLSAETNRKGAFEFSIVYTGFSSETKFVTLPCDVY